MCQSAKICLLWVSLLMMAMAEPLHAQDTFPRAGTDMQYSAAIETSRAYISGICIIQNNGTEARGSLFNEFGISALDFTYNISSHKVKLHSVAKMLDKWYIKRVIRKDLSQLMDCLQHGITEYKNDKHHLRYQLTPMPTSAEETEEHNATSE